MTAPKALLLSAVALIGLCAGFFYAYEASVTLGLARVDDVTYVTTFQALNETIRNPAFGLVFFGAVPVTVGALVANWDHGSLRRRLIGAGLCLYLTGMAVTVAGNVPLNNGLAELSAVEPDSAAAARAVFERDWNRLNLTRTIAFTAGFALLTIASVHPNTPARGVRSPGPNPTHDQDEDDAVGNGAERQVPQTGERRHPDDPPGRADTQRQGDGGQ